MEKNRADTIFLLDILSSALPVASPIGNTGAGLWIGDGVGEVTHDLDAKEAVREVTVVESEAEISVGGWSTSGEGGFHSQYRVEQIRVRTPHSLKMPSQEEDDELGGEV